jgi:hypothetical protein
MARGPHGAHRSLEALAQNGSTARLFNLSAVAEENVGDVEYAARPFFETPLLNTALIVKHGLRAHELPLFDAPPGIATKIIIPFDRRDLGLGGRSVFVDQRRWQQELGALTHEPPSLARDLLVLQALDELPSLDPFLVREHLARRGFKVATCYFALPDHVLERMKRLVASELRQLIERAFTGTAASGEHTSRLVELLLTDEADARLEPLRQTLRLEGEAYREGIFAWKGFLYYKWVLAELGEPLARVTGALAMLRTPGTPGAELRAEIARAKTRLLRRIEQSQKAALQALRVYDDAYGMMVRQDDPTAFRDFLLRSPQMFLRLGEAVGGVSHVTSYWNYRFPAGAPSHALGIELLDTLQAFEGSLAASPDLEGG